ncbi:hypothetical protein GN244_ATG00671 [Phytophthora infestans]|uniref:Uncharacterized protein n=1 Tax=Phytophthora infestans TaxID=4787 RepID=A0A833TH81_PHYIN|nr:hypothetical protein GN244_ATG00671 [Phytophthora infestans]KAF4136235.1 hypothetical protein GN958_ATG14576 [Phytophthora infestans]
MEERGCWLSVGVLDASQIRPSFCFSEFETDEAVDNNETTRPPAVVEELLLKGGITVDCHREQVEFTKRYFQPPPDVPARSTAADFRGPAVERIRSDGFEASFQGREMASTLLSRQQIRSTETSWHSQSNE